MTRDTRILWSDDSGPIPARIHDDGRCTVDAVALLAIVADCTGPADYALRAIVDVDALADTLHSLATIAPDVDGRYDIRPMAGEIVESDASGRELERR